MNVRTEEDATIRESPSTTPEKLLECIKDYVDSLHDENPLYSDFNDEVNRGYECARILLGDTNPISIVQRLTTTPFNMLSDDEKILYFRINFLYQLNHFLNKPDEFKSYVTEKNLRSTDSFTFPETEADGEREAALTILKNNSRVLEKLSSSTTNKLPAKAKQSILTASDTAEVQIKDLELKLKNSDESLEKCKNKETELNRQFNAVATKSYELEKQLEKKDEQIEDLNKAYKDQRSVNLILSNRLTRIARDLTQKNDELQTLQNTLTNTKNSYEEQLEENRKHEEERDNCEDDLEVTNRKLEDVSTKIEELTKSTLHLNLEVATLTKGKIALLQEIDNQVQLKSDCEKELQKKIDDEYDITRDADHLHNKSKVVSSDDDGPVMSLDQELLKEPETESLREELAAVEERIITLDKLKLDTLEEINVLKAKNNELEKQKEAGEKALMIAKETCLTTTDELRKKVGSLEVEMKDKKTEILRLDEDFNQAKNELDTCNNRTCADQSKLTSQRYYKITCNMTLIMIAIPFLIFSFLLNTTLQNSKTLFVNDDQLHSSITRLNTIMFLCGLGLSLGFILLLNVNTISMNVLAIIEFVYLMMIFLVIGMIGEIRKLSHDTYKIYETFLYIFLAFLGTVCILQAILYKYFN